MFNIDMNGAIDINTVAAVALQSSSCQFPLYLAGGEAP